MGPMPSLPVSSMKTRTYCNLRHSCKTSFHTCWHNACAIRHSDICRNTMYNHKADKPEVTYLMPAEKAVQQCSELLLQQSFKVDLHT